MRAFSDGPCNTFCKTPSPSTLIFQEPGKVTVPPTNCNDSPAAINFEIQDKLVIVGPCVIGRPLCQVSKQGEVHFMHAKECEQERSSSACSLVEPHLPLASLVQSNCCGVDSLPLD